MKLWIRLDLEMDVKDEDFKRTERPFNVDEFIANNSDVIKKLIKNIQTEDLRSIKAIEAGEMYSGAYSAT